MSADTSPAVPAAPPRLSGPGVPAAPVPAPYRPTRTLHLAAAIDGREQDAAGSYLELARLAERGALDFVTLGGCAGAALDAVAVLARISSATDRIGVLPALAAVPGATADLARAVATLDWVSQGRAGWTVTAGGESGGESERESGREAEPASGRRPEVAAVRGAAARRRDAERAEARWRSAEAVAEAVALAWDGGGPRARRGRPVIAVDATDPAAQATAARHADIAFVRAARPDQADSVRTELRRLAAAAGRDPDRLLVLAELSVDLSGGELGPEPGAETAPVPDRQGGVLFSGGPVDLADLIAEWQRSGAVDGFHVRPVEPRRDLERFVNGTAALLQHRGLFRAFHPGATLREHLGLHRPANSPVNRLAAAGGVGL